MKNDTLRWENEKKTYETLFYAILERHTKIIDISRKEKSIGYTDDSGYIHMAKSAPLFSKLSTEKKAFFRKGVFAHETLHQCFTDFDHMNKIMDSDKYTYTEKNVIMSFANLVEDPAIEYQAPSVFGGSLLNALRFTIAHIYKKAKGIEESDSAFAQLENALIQFGDMGIVKGEFTYPEAYECFKKIAPEFNRAILTPSSKDRIDMAIKWMDDTRPLWEDDNPALLNNEIQKIQNENSISTPQGKGTQQIPADEIFNNGKDEAAEIREDFINALESDDEDEIRCFVQSKEEADKMVSYPSMSDSNSNSNSTVVNAEKKEETASLEEIKDFSVQAGVSCKNKRVAAKNADIPIYEAITKAHVRTISLLENSLKRIFMADEGELLHKTAGKYNIERGAIGTTVNIFDKRKAPKNLKNIAIFLLIDESGSMYGGKISIARDSAIILAETLSRLKIPCYIMGFTADHNNVSVYHDHFVTWTNLKKERYSLVEIEAKSNNDDAYSIKYATELLRQYNAEHKLLFIVSDGMPACYRFNRLKGIQETTLAVNNAKKICKVLGLGIGIDNKRYSEYSQIYGKDVILVTDPSELATTMAIQLKRIIRNF